MLSGLSWLVARNRGVNPPLEVCKHLTVAFVVIGISRLIATVILDMSGR